MCVRALWLASLCMCLCCMTWLSPPQQQYLHAYGATHAVFLSTPYPRNVAPSVPAGGHLPNSSLFLALPEHPQMTEDLRDQCNEYVPDCVQEIKIPRPHDPALSDQYIGISNYGRVSS